MTLFDLTIDGRSYDELSLDEQAAFDIVGYFSNEQRDWFASHWLRVTEEEEMAINSALPSETKVASLQSEADRFIGSDLLTDCGSGSTYAQAADLLRQLPLVEWSAA